jgi:Tol biopolymer transport system component
MVWNALRVAAAVTVIAALGGYAAWTLKPAPSRSVAVTRFSVALPEDMRLTGGTARNIAMSPDGSRIALVANDQLYVRNLAADEEFHPITGTDQNLRLRFPFFSPDGQWLAFWSTSDGGTLKKIPVTGGAAIPICEVRSTFGTPYGASWSPDNLIFIGGGPNGILRVSADGGRPETIIGVNSGQFASNPQLLPDGEHVLFTLREPDSEVDLTRQRNWDQAKLVVESLKSRERKVLIDGGYDGRYSATGHIVYVLASTLWARRFDLATRQVSGEPLPVVEGVATEGLGRFSTGSADFSFSRDGAMAYVPAARRNARPLRSLALIDLSGRITPVDLPAGPYHSPRFSLPDGKQVALYTTDGVVWIYHLSGTKPIRKLTHKGGYLFPIWTRDGRVVFNSIVEGQRGLFWQPADGSAPVERLTSSSAFPYSVSPDGRTIFAGGERSSLGQAIVTLSLNGDAVSQTVFQGARGDVVFSPSLSPDGRWLAYELRHENKHNVYVDPFPPTGAHHPVTIDSGSNPMWSPDGKRLFYVRETAQEMGRERAIFYSVEILRTDASFEHGKSNALFSVDGLFIRGSLAGNIVDLSPDGKQFVTLLLPPGSDGEPEQPQVNVVLNWFAELKQHVAVK